MPDYYNKAFQGGPRIGNKPETEFKSGLFTSNLATGGMGQYANKLAMKLPGMSKMLGHAQKIPGFGGLFGSEKKPSAKELLMYNYSRVGALQARADAETDVKKKAKFMQQLDKSKGAVEKYAYKIDKKHRPGGKFLPPRTYDEIDAGRKAYVEKMAALEKSGPLGPTRTVKRSL